MLLENRVFKSFLPPALTTFNGITYVIPGWHIVPSTTTLKEVYDHWTQEMVTSTLETNPISIINEKIVSGRTGEKYTVSFNGKYWSCTCMGFDFRDKCKHILQMKQKYTKL